MRRPMCVVFALLSEMTFFIDGVNTMQIQYNCPDCFQEKIRNKDIFGIIDTSFSVELNDNCMMTYECPQGHKGIFVIQNPKFEVLFDLGIISYLEGYTNGDCYCL